MKDRLDEAIEYAENKLMNCDKTCGCGCPVDLGCMGKPKKELKVLKFYNNLFPNRIGIQLKNIDLTGYTYGQQLSKINEEYKEFIDAVEEYRYYLSLSETDHTVSEDTLYKAESHMIEEYYDLMQAGLGVISFEGVEAEEVMQGYDKHLSKMEQRGNKPREKVEK